MKINSIYSKRVLRPLGVAMAALMLLSSCENDFDANIYGQLYPGNFPSTKSEYTSYMMTCYVPFTTTWTYAMDANGVQHGWYIQSGGCMRMFDAPSDICGVSNTIGWGDYRALTIGNFDHCRYYYRGSVDDGSNLNHFQKTAQITRLTEIIGTLEKAPESALTAGERNSLLGEARICRGMMMYWLLHTFGPVPVILDPAKVTDSAALSDTERPTLDDMSRWIEEDLAFGAENAPEVAPEQGRYTRDYARFCLMAHYLNEGGHMAGYYGKAIEMYNALNTGRYSLYTTGSNPYADQFLNANKFNREVIMAVACSETADGNSRHGNLNPFLMWALPSNVAKEGLFPQGGGWFQQYSVDLKFYDTFEEKDMRKATIVTSYKQSDGRQITRQDVGNIWDGYIVYKWPQETRTTYQGQDIPLARWADVLLMYAEADCRNTGAVSNGAIEAVNKVRRRAGLDNLPASATASKDAFLDAILTERGHELFFEGTRKIDLIRFNVFAQKMYNKCGELPTHQYMPIPNYAVSQSAEAGKNLEQTWSRDNWQDDLGSCIEK